MCRAIQHSLHPPYHPFEKVTFGRPFLDKWWSCVAVCPGKHAHEPRVQAQTCHLAGLSWVPTSFSSCPWRHVYPLNSHWGVGVSKHPDEEMSLEPKWKIRPPAPLHLLEPQVHGNYISIYTPACTPGLKARWSRYFLTWRCRQLQVPVFPFIDFWMRRPYVARTEKFPYRASPFTATFARITAISSRLGSASGVASLKHG